METLRELLDRRAHELSFTGPMLDRLMRERGLSQGALGRILRLTGHTIGRYRKDPGELSPMTKLDIFMLFGAPDRPPGDGQ